MPWHLALSENRAVLENTDLRVQVECYFPRTPQGVPTYFDLSVIFPKTLPGTVVEEIQKVVKQAGDQVMMPHRDSQKGFCIRQDIPSRSAFQKNYLEYLDRMQNQLAEKLSQDARSENEMRLHFQEMKAYLSLRPASLKALCMRGMHTLFPKSLREQLLAEAPSTLRKETLAFPTR